jgi:site-specific recombinase XerD
VLITHVGRRAAVLRHATATRFLEDIQGLDDRAAQQLMARLTGNFKRGNERR